MMRRPFAAALLAFPTLLLSCMFGDADGRSEAMVGAPAAAAAETPPALVEDPATEPEAVTAAEPPTPPKFVPRGGFPSIDALCAEQKRLIVPQLLEAQRFFADRGENETIVPACGEARKVLAHARIRLSAPYLEVRAID